MDAEHEKRGEMDEEDITKSGPLCCKHVVEVCDRGFSNSYQKLVCFSFLKQMNQYQLFGRKNVAC